MDERRKNERRASDRRAEERRRSADQPDDELKRKPGIRRTKTRRRYHQRRWS